MAILFSLKFSDFVIAKTGISITNELLITGLPIVVNADNHVVLAREKQNTEILKRSGQAVLLTPSTDTSANE